MKNEEWRMKNEECILYDNKIYKKNKKHTKYYKDKNKNVEIFKCNNVRKKERVGKAANLGEYYSTRIKKYKKKKIKIIKI